MADTTATDGSDLAAPTGFDDGADLTAIEHAVHAQVVDGEIDLLDDSSGVTLAGLIRGHEPLLSEAAVRLVTKRLVARVVGLGPLQPFLEDETVSDVLVNGDGSVWIERCGRLERTHLDVDEATTLHLIERIVGPLGLRADRSSPLVDARLPDGSRVNAIVRPLAIDGPCLTIRRFAVRPLPLSEFCRGGVHDLLQWAIRSRRNVMVSGGTGTGKTTLLNALAASLPRTERIITIEDAAELRLPGEHVVRLESRPANTEGAGAVAIRDLVRNALRMRPDRIIIGEVRAGEALDLLQAMNTGHEGSLSTLHANSTADALRRLETMVLMCDLALPLPAIREQVASSIDLVVQVTRRGDGARQVAAIGEVGAALDGAGRLTVRPLVSNGRLVDLPNRASRVSGGVAPDPAWLA